MAKTDANDLVAMIQADHRKVEQLFERIESTEGDERAGLVEELVAELLVHMELEEREIYPLVEEDVDAEMAEEAETEHDLARDGVAKMRELSPDGPGFGAALEMVKAGILHHVREEEEEVLPKLQEQLTPEAVAELTERLTSLKAELLESGPDGLRDKPRTGKKRSGGSKRSGGAKRSSDDDGNDGDDEPTKAELVEQAKEKGISGYSKMKKDELAKAVRDA